MAMSSLVGPGNCWLKSSLICHAIRLKPGQNITDEIASYVTSNNLSSAYIMTCVGSIKKAKLRFAHASSKDDQDQHIVDLDDKYEITSLVGTVAASGNYHLHATLGDYKGNSISGHVVGDMEVFTTAEIVIGECNNLLFMREFDQQTGFNELVVKEKQH